MRRPKCALTPSWKTITFLILVAVTVTVFVPFSAGHDRGGVLAIPLLEPSDTRPATITADDVVKLIEQLGASDFLKRDVAQNELIAAGSQNLPNLLLIKSFLEENGVQSSDPEIRARSQRILDALLPVSMCGITDPIANTFACNLYETNAEGLPTETPERIFLPVQLDHDVRYFVVFLERDTPAGQEKNAAFWSDVLYINLGGDVELFSDVEGGASLAEVRIPIGIVDVNKAFAEGFADKPTIYTPEVGFPQIYVDGLGNTYRVYSDNIPEPSSLTLVGIGVLVFLSYGRACSAGFRSRAIRAFILPTLLATREISDAGPTLASAQVIGPRASSDGLGLLLHLQLWPFILFSFVD